MGYQNYLKRYYTLFGENSELASEPKQPARTKRPRRQREDQATLEDVSDEEEESESLAHARGQIGYAGLEGSAAAHLKASS